MNVRIVSDSSSNLLSVSDASYATVPLKIITQAREYVDNAALDVASMIRDLRTVKGRTQTSCPNAFEWQEAFGDAECVFAVTITSGLSGSYDAACKAREDALAAAPARRICVVDSLSTGPEMQLLIEHLRDGILAGRSFEELEASVKEYQRHTHLLFALESLTNLARNGRVSPVVARVAGLLGIRVVGVASEQGTLQTLCKPRGEHKMLEALYREMERGGYLGGKLRIAHCNNPTAAQAFADTVRERYASADIAIIPTTALCSYYAEEGGLMVGFEG
ncbi:MAG: DegV family protein [Clostridia bacterium]|nr:DegV family protein [Clostridia bacterium]